MGLQLADVDDEVGFRRRPDDREDEAFERPGDLHLYRSEVVVQADPFLFRRRLHPGGLVDAQEGGVVIEPAGGIGDGDVLRGDTAAFQPADDRPDDGRVGGSRLLRPPLH